MIMAYNIGVNQKNNNDYNKNNRYISEKIVLIKMIIDNKKINNKDRFWESQGK